MMDSKVLTQSLAPEQGVSTVLVLTHAEVLSGVLAHSCLLMLSTLLHYVSLFLQNLHCKVLSNSLLGMHFLHFYFVLILWSNLARLFLIESS